MADSGQRIEVMGRPERARREGWSPWGSRLAHEFQRRFSILSKPDTYKFETMAGVSPVIADEITDSTRALVRGGAMLKQSSFARSEDSWEFSKNLLAHTIRKAITPFQKVFTPVGLIKTSSDAESYYTQAYDNPGARRATVELVTRLTARVQGIDIAKPEGVRTAARSGSELVNAAGFLTLVSLICEQEGLPVERDLEEVRKRFKALLPNEDLPLRISDDGRFEGSPEGHNNRVALWMSLAGVNAHYKAQQLPRALYEHNVARSMKDKEPVGVPDRLNLENPASFANTPYSDLTRTLFQENIATQKGTNKRENARNAAYLAAYALSRDLDVLKAAVVRDGETLTEELIEEGAYQKNVSPGDETIAAYYPAATEVQPQERSTPKRKTARIPAFAAVVLALATAASGLQREKNPSAEDGMRIAGAEQGATLHEQVFGVSPVTPKDAQKNITPAVVPADSENLGIIGTLIQTEKVKQGSGKAPITLAEELVENFGIDAFVARYDFSREKPGMSANDIATRLVIDAGMWKPGNEAKGIQEQSYSLVGGEQMSIEQGTNQIILIRASERIVLTAPDGTVQHFDFPLSAAGDSGASSESDPEVRL